ncbi:unnamed protein product [Cuscuta epithymum]|uniref:Thioredoxin-like fold domain-containing protein MRL7L, chloroplastic n=1 Tax=Cuscuta epithymum TaxID=186058 RepID=A0AAV0DG43_9ASTE|nr:unnamed protein product [Cuscuta epithymum]CAH9125285.1 unnamed protein product [Cuscuta epithymum]
MELQQLAVRTPFLSSLSRNGTSSFRRNQQRMSTILPSRLLILTPLWLPLFSSSSLSDANFITCGIRASKIEELLSFHNGNDKDDEDYESDKSDKKVDDDSFVMDKEERLEWRRKIRKVMDTYPEIKEEEEETDMDDKQKRIQKLLADYPLVVEEEDPDWPEDAEGRGFNLDQFFNKITIKNVKKDNDDDNDDDFNSENEIVWQDDDYIRPIKDLTTPHWEEAVFKDFSPLILLVHNRYMRPKENEKLRNELEKAVHVFWNCRIPSPRCLAIDAVVEHDLVSALNVSIFPELIFTKSGKILHREKALRSADDLSKVIAFFYYGAAKPPCLDASVNGDGEEKVPTVQTSHKEG